MRFAVMTAGLAGCLLISFRRKGQHLSTLLPAADVAICCAEGQPRSPLAMAQQILHTLEDQGYLRWALPALPLIGCYRWLRLVAGSERAAGSVQHNSQSLFSFQRKLTTRVGGANALHIIAFLFFSSTLGYPANGSKSTNPAGTPPSQRWLLPKRCSASTVMGCWTLLSSDLWLCTDGLKPKACWHLLHVSRS